MINEVNEGDTIAIWVSCGAASMVAAKKTAEIYGNLCDLRFLNNPIAEEHYDNQRFLKDGEQWLGHEIEIVTSKEYPSNSCMDVWAKRKFMSSPQGAPCTMILKKHARQEWEAENIVDWHVLGFTFDKLERKRHEKFILTERSNLLPILIDAELTKADCFQIIRNAGLKLPEIYSLGYPNANCIGCVKATSPTYWNHVRKIHPDVFDERAKQSREIGAKLARVRSERIYLDELDPKAKGRPMDTMDFECGIFCMERI